MGKIGSTSLNDEPGYMALENQDWDAAYRRLVAHEDLPGMTIGAIAALVLVLCFASWAWAFVGSS